MSVSPFLTWSPSAATREICKPASAVWNICSSVDLNIPGNEGVYSKAQAELILKDFFAKNNPTGYKTLHKGSSRDGALYSIGNLQTEKGIYRAYFYMKKKGEDYFIHEFSLNSEEKDE